MLFVGIIFVLVFGPCVHAASDTTKCNINDPDASNCVLKALNSLRQNDREGKQIDPFVIPTFHSVQESSTLNYTGTAKNYVVQGLNNFDVKYVKFDPAIMTFHGRVEYEPLKIHSDYELDGHWASISIEGSGRLQAIIGPINATVTVNGKIVNHKGIKQYNPTGLKIRMTIEDAKNIHLDGVFRQNPELARVTNQALNDNSKVIIDALTPAFEILSEKVFLHSIKFISKKILYV